MIFHPELIRYEDGWVLAGMGERRADGREFEAWIHEADLPDFAPYDWVYSQWCNKERLHGLLLYNSGCHDLDGLCDAIMLIMVHDMP